MSIKNSSDTIGNRTSDLPACSAGPQQTAPTRAPVSLRNLVNYPVTSFCFGPSIFQIPLFSSFSKYQAIFHKHKNQVGVCIRSDALRDISVATSYRSCGYAEHRVCNILLCRRPALHYGMSSH
jgi:ribosomal protein L40E